MKSTLRQFLAELQKYANENPEMLDKSIQIRIPDFVPNSQGPDRYALLACFDPKENSFSIEDDKTLLHLDNDGEEN